MTRVYVSTVIDASPAEVWSFVEPIERHVDWMVDATAIHFDGKQTRGVGTRFTCDTQVGPIKLTDHMEVTAWMPGKEMGVRHHGLVAGTGRFTLSPAVQGGTLFAWEEELRFPWFLGGPVGASVGGRTVLPRLWRHNLARLKQLVESGR